MNENNNTKIKNENIKAYKIQKTHILLHSFIDTMRDGA